MSDKKGGGKKKQQVITEDEGFEITAAVTSPYSGSLRSTSEINNPITQGIQGSIAAGGVMQEVDSRRQSRAHSLSTLVQATLHTDGLR